MAEATGWVGVNVCFVLCSRGCLIATLYTMYRGREKYALSFTHWSKVWCIDCVLFGVAPAYDNSVDPFNKQERVGRRVRGN